MNVLRNVFLADPGFRWRNVAKLSTLSAGMGSSVSYEVQATDVSQGLLTCSAGTLALGRLDPSPGAANLPAPGMARRRLSPGDLGAIASLPALSSPVPPSLGGLFSVQLSAASPSAPTWIVIGALLAHQSLGAKGTLLALWPVCWIPPATVLEDVQYGGKSPGHPPTRRPSWTCSIRPEPDR